MNTLVLMPMTMTPELWWLLALCVGGYAMAFLPARIPTRIVSGIGIASVLAAYLVIIDGGCDWWWCCIGIICLW